MRNVQLRAKYFQHDAQQIIFQEIVMRDVYGFYRLANIIGRPARPTKCGKPAKPAIPPIIPVSKSTWWQGVKDGRYPAPIKLSPAVTVWRASDIEALCERINRESSTTN